MSSQINSGWFRCQRNTYDVEKLVAIDSDTVCQLDTLYTLVKSLVVVLLGESTSKDAKS
jgi:hypothetical protein